MPDAKNSCNFSDFIDFVEQDVRMDDHPFAGAVLTFTTDVGEHGEICGSVD